MSDWSVGTSTDIGARPGRVYVLEPNEPLFPPPGGGLPVMRTVCVARDEETAEEIARLHNVSEKVTDAVIEAGMQSLGGGCTKHEPKEKRVVLKGEDTVGYWYAQICKLCGAVYVEKEPST